MEIKYEESLFYQISSTAKYFDMLTEQFFKELNLGIEAIEYFALCVVAEHKNCCQRDLAKVLLKDRANTGKLAKKIEEKGLIKIQAGEKNNKLVKILTITQKGKGLMQIVQDKVQPMVDKIRGEMTPEKIDDMLKNIISFRQIVKKTVKINI